MLLASPMAASARTSPVEPLPARAGRSKSPAEPSRRRERVLVRAAQEGSGEALETLFAWHWPRPTGRRT